MRDGGFMMWTWYVSCHGALQLYAVRAGASAVITQTGRTNVW